MYVVVFGCVCAFLCNMYVGVYACVSLHMAVLVCVCMCIFVCVCVCMVCECCGWLTVSVCACMHACKDVFHCQKKLI